MKLIKDINGKIINDINGSTIYNKSIIGEMQLEDYINLNGFLGLMQNLSQVEVTERMLYTPSYGVLNSDSLSVTNLNIEY